MKSKELREKKLTLVTEVRKMNEQIKAEGRDYSAEESEQFDRIMEEVKQLDTQIADVEAKETRSAFLADAENWLAQPSRERVETSEPKKLVADFRSQAFSKYIRHGLQGLNNTEYRALAQDTDNVGGYLNPDHVFNSNLIAALNNNVFVRQYARVFSFTGSDTLSFPKKTADLSAPTWTTEINGPSEDSSLRVGRIDLKPNQLSKLVKVSMKLLMCSSFPVEQFVAEELGYQFAVTQENSFLNGDGAGECMGIFEASETGCISTDQDVDTGNEETAITADGLQNAKYHMRPQYRSASRWVFHNDAIKQIATLKDGEGRYMWQPSMVESQPDRLLGLPVDVSAYCPNTFTTGLYVGALVNWSQGYYIGDLQTLQVQRVNELYAGTSQIGFIGRMYTDAKNVDDNAFVRVTLA